MTNSPAEGFPPPEAKRKTAWAWTVATFFGAGLGKPGPGTWGSVAAVLLWGAIAWLFHPTPNGLLLVVFIGVVISIAAGVPAATIAARDETPNLAKIRRKCVPTVHTLISRTAAIALFT